MRMRIKETLINCLCGMKCKAHGAQEPRHIQKYVEVTIDTANRYNLYLFAVSHRATLYFGNWPTHAINQRFLNYLLIACCIIAIQLPAASAKDPSPEQLVAEHLKSIGEPEALSQAKTTSFVGTAEVNFLQGMQNAKIMGHQYLIGTSMLVSQGSQIGLSMKFSDNNYPGEYFAYDGKSVTVRNIQPGQKSPIADFLYRYNKIMKNGLLGGVFSKAWPLFDIRSNRPNIRVRKTRVEGTELYALEYNPRDRHSDMRIRLFFDPDTYRHVRTEYEVRLGNGEITDVLTENFGNFKKVGSLTLPHNYSLYYTVTGSHPYRALVNTQSRSSEFMAGWKINIQEIVVDTPNIPQNLFKAE